MAVDSLRTHLIDELKDLLDAENQLTSALPKLASSASTPALRTAFQKHLKETRGHIARLNEAMRELGERPRRKTCEAMEGLLTEGEKMMNEAPEGALRDAVMITAAQKVEHYEMATYGTVRTYAEVLGERGVARLLAQTLKEEKAADAKLTMIAGGMDVGDARRRIPSTRGRCPPRRRCGRRCAGTSQEPPHVPARIVAQAGQLEEALACHFFPLDFDFLNQE
jgi:ferritin-like metal-binding protein YciE